MARADFRLRSLLLKIDQQLTNDERKRLCFIIGCEDVPRRVLEVVERNNAAPMTDIWEALFDRRKIAMDNVNYLIERLQKIERFDLAELLKNCYPLQFSLSAQPVPQSTNQVLQRAAMPNLFTRIDP
ncbi:hypothetical protein I4U23_006481 [Adineta vaga]|nr:hypothetical protein I4U23_006481 [Adineta vaga]